MTRRAITFLIIGIAGAVSACGGGQSRESPLPADRDAPRITLNGSNPTRISLGGVYADAGATAVDSRDGQVTVTRSGTVDTSQSGTYEITYTAKDAAGNAATAVRTVYVVGTGPDVTPPVITIHGQAQSRVQLGTTYVDPGASATDITDGPVDVALSGAVDTDEMGIYALNYSATDSAGNTATARRLVEVVDPERSALANDGHYIVGTILIPVGGGEQRALDLHVQRHVLEGNVWTTRPLILEDGRGPTEIFEAHKRKWQSLYATMAERGMTTSNIKQVLRGVTRRGDRNVGAYVRTGLGACGYAGSARTITCGINAAVHILAHESMHGWQWEIGESPPNPANSILLMDIFTRWANWVYHTRYEAPEKLQGQIGIRRWELNYLNYGLQNDAEWLANVFAGWLYNPTQHLDESWQVMVDSAPAFKQFIDCLWTTDTGLQLCHAQTLGENHISHPQYHPDAGVPAVEGFSTEDATAIWKICGNSPDKARYVAHFNTLIRRTAPDLPGSPADFYELGFGDCNHDGVTDWTCTYVGPGPTGLGNGRYLWNAENTQGAYTFVVSGRRGDTYAEYFPDPYIESLRSLVQPWYREWQGRHGSCNGASIFSYRSLEWANEYLKDLER